MPRIRRFMKYARMLSEFAWGCIAFLVGAVVVISISLPLAAFAAIGKCANTALEWIGDRVEYQFCDWLIRRAEPWQTRNDD